MHSPHVSQSNVGLQGKSCVGSILKFYAKLKIIWSPRVFNTKKKILTLRSEECSLFEMEEQNSRICEDNFTDLVGTSLEYLIFHV